MRLIKEEKLNKTIEEPFDYVFNIEKDGLYLIEIVASACSWWQNFRKLVSFFKDDNLAVKIDGIDFPKLNGKRGLFDGEAAWNGNNLKGLKKTNLFLLPLSARSHALNFLYKQEPTIISIVISEIEEYEKKEQIIYVPTINNPAQDGDRRQWMTIIALDVDIKEFVVKARAGKTGRDDDDIKLIINGGIQENKEPKSHPQWFWCGRTLKDKGKIFTKDLNLKKGLHYFEFWADKSPFIRRIEITTEEYEEKLVSTKRIPTVDDPKWTGDFNDDPEEILMARLIFGEARNQPDEAKEWVAWSIINRVNAHSWWGNTIREVILYDGQYDPFKPSDPNYPYMLDPLKDSVEDDVVAWRTCYGIAHDVVSEKKENPTTATHFHGVGVTRDWFEKHFVPDGKFLKKIGGTYFYWSPY